MKPELLEKLLNAGFTKDEIIQLARDEPNPEPTPNPDPTPNPEPNPEPTPNPEPNPEPTPNPTLEPNPVSDATEKRLSGIEKGISDLIKAVQASNLKNDSFGNSADSLEAQTDRIMASIIRPEKAGKDGQK